MDTINHVVFYLRTRLSSKVEIIIKGDQTINSKVCIPLFEWVIENLCKNAIDAMKATGSLIITVGEKGSQIFIDISDTGAGIKSGDKKTVFQPGYSTKKRGWGLGLSLSKRIIEEYHAGKIFVKESKLGDGATFRILLNK